MTSANRLPSVWYCTEHGEIHHGDLTAFATDHQAELHPVFWEPKIGWSPRSFTETDLAECDYCHAVLTPADRRPGFGSAAGAWVCRDGDACDGRLAVTAKHVPADPFEGLPG